MERSRPEFIYPNAGPKSIPALSGARQKRQREGGRPGLRWRWQLQWEQSACTGLVWQRFGSEHSLDGIVRASDRGEGQEREEELPDMDSGDPGERCDDAMDGQRRGRRAGTGAG